jgi:Family of unknown function (DUF6653)
VQWHRFVDDLGTGLCVYLPLRLTKRWSSETQRLTQSGASSVGFSVSVQSKLRVSMSNFFRMDEAVWRRHANPWSVYTRFAAIPAMILAV